MKKGVIFLTLLLAASLAGTYAVWELYVKQRMEDLGAHQKEEEKLTKKLTQLEETFFRTKPDTVLSIWRTEIQPWADAVDRRTDFYNIGQIPLKVEIPVEERDLAKWFYKKEQPKMVQALYTRAWESGINLPDPAFGTPDPDFYGQGSNPSADEISQHLARIEFGKAVAELLIVSGVKSGSVLEIWPEQIAFRGRSGDIKSRTVGLAFTIPMRDFVVFIDKLSQQDRYFEVKALHLTNTALRYRDAHLNVEMILAQAYYEQASQTRVVASEIGSPILMRGMLANLLGGLSANEVQSNISRRAENKKNLWQRFRRRFLPF